MVFRTLSPEMLARGELKLFGAIMLVLSKMCFLPTEWISNGYKMNYVSNRVRLTINVAGRVWTVLYFIFAAVRIIPSYEGFGVTQPVHYSMIHGLSFIFHWYPVMVDLAFTLYGTQIVAFYNQLVIFNRDSGIHSKLQRL